MYNLVPEINPIEHEHVNFAVFGPQELPTELPTRLVGTNTLALTRAFPNHNTQDCRQLVHIAIWYIYK